MKLYLDGDAFPNLLKPVLFRAIERVGLKTDVISNKIINIGQSKFISYIIVGSKLDEADDKIAELVVEGDLVITADILLADRILMKNAHAINHHGVRFDADNIKNNLAMRNLMQELRDSGEITGGPPPFSKKDVSKFASQLNHFLQRR